MLAGLTVAVSMLGGFGVYLVEEEIQAPGGAQRELQRATGGSLVIGESLHPSSLTGGLDAAARAQIDAHFKILEGGGN